MNLPRLSISQKSLTQPRLQSFSAPASLGQEFWCPQTHRGQGVLTSMFLSKRLCRDARCCPGLEMPDAALGSLAAALSSLCWMLCEERRELGCKLLWESVSCVRRGQHTEAGRKGKNSNPRSPFSAPTHSSPPPQPMHMPPRFSPPQPFPHINPHPYLHTYGKGLFSPQHTSLHTSPVFTLFSHHYHTPFTLILLHICHALARQLLVLGIMFSTSSQRSMSVGSLSDLNESPHNEGFLLLL